MDFLKIFSNIPSLQSFHSLWGKSFLVGFEDPFYFRQIYFVLEICSFKTLWVRMYFCSTITQKIYLLALQVIYWKGLIYEKIITQWPALVSSCEDNIVGVFVFVRQSSYYYIVRRINLVDFSIFSIEYVSHPVQSFLITCKTTVWNETLFPDAIS